jgi:O-antigen/teichoic acid export membrane protein
VTVVVVRTLGTQDFGQWATVLSVAQITGFLADFGVQQVTVRRAAARPEEEAQLFGALVTLRIAMAVPVALGSGLITSLISTTSEMAVAGLMVSGTLLLGAPGALNAVFQARVRNEMAVLSTTVYTLVWGAAVVGIAAAGGGVVAFAFALAVATAVKASADVFFALRLARVTTSGVVRWWPTLVRSGVPLGLAALMALVYARLDQILVFELAGERDASLYGAVYRIFDQAQFVPLSLMTTMLPLLSAAARHDPQRLRRLVQVGAEFIALVTLPILGFALVGARPLIPLLFGEEFADAAPALPILMGAFVLISYGYLLTYLMISLELQTRLFWISAITLVVNVSLNMALIPFYGFLAAASVAAASHGLVVLLSWRVVRRLVTFDMRASRLPRVALAAMGMLATVVIGHVGGAGLGSLTVIAGVTYLTLVLTFKAVDLRAALGYLRRAEIGG